MNVQCGGRFVQMLTRICRIWWCQVERWPAGSTEALVLIQVERDRCVFMVLFVVMLTLCYVLFP